MKVLQAHDKPFSIPVTVDARFGGADGTPAGREGGMAVYLDELARGLMGRGHRVAELRFGAAASTPKQTHAPGRHSAIASGLIPRLSPFRALAEALDAERPDVVHLHSTYHAVNPLLLGWLARRCPTVLTQHDVTPFCLKETKLRADGTLCCERAGLRCVSSGCFRPGAGAGLARDGLRAAAATARVRAMGEVACIIAPSRYIGREAVLNGVPAAKVRVLGHFSPYEDPPFVEPPNRGRILFVGRMVAEKGMAILLEALGHLAARPWEATLVGEGPLKAAALRSPAGGEVRFAGAIARADMPEQFRRADIVVVPSLIPESFGLVGVEAMSFGRPVVAFRGGGISEWLIDGVTGLFAEHGSARDLARKIDVLLADGQMRRSFAAAARRLAAERFTAAAHLDALESIYAEAAGARLFRSSAVGAGLEARKKDAAVPSEKPPRRVGMPRR